MATRKQYKKMIEENLNKKTIPVQVVTNKFVRTVEIEPTPAAVARLQKHITKELKEAEAASMSLKKQIEQAETQIVKPSRGLRAIMKEIWEDSPKGLAFSNRHRERKQEKKEAIDRFKKSLLTPYHI